MGGIAFAMLVASVRAEPAADASAKSVLTVAVPSINQTYDDLKFLFDLVGDKKGFKTFKDTLDTFAEGVQTDQRIGIRSYVTPEGFQEVASIPVKTDADFKKFVKNLWDLDVKTAPPPTPSQLPQVTREARAKLGKTKLQANERLIFGLAHGYLRYEAGHVHIGESLEAVRSAHAGVDVEAPRGTIVAIEIDGQSATPGHRREALAKSRKDAVSRLKKHDGDSAADFALKQQLEEFEFAKLELLLGDAARGRLAWTLSRETKHAQIEGQVSAVKDSALAKDIANIGQSADKFAGIASEKTALAATINLPVDAGLGKALVSLTHAGREVAIERIDGAKELKPEQKATDKALADFVFDVADEVAGMPIFNGFARTWANPSGHLTTVGAVAIADGSKFHERLRKIPSSERVEHQAGGNKNLEIHKVAATKWRQDYAELFDKDGAILIGVSDEAVWYATGDEALQRLEQALQEAHGEAKSKSQSAFDLHVRMQPLAQAWNAIRTRHPAGESANREKDKTKDKTKDKSERNEKNKLAGTTSNVADLELYKIAAEAFGKGKDELSLTLTRKGDDAHLSIESDEGMLQFFARALSKFVKVNLEDE